MRARASSGCMRSARGVEPTTSAKRTVTSLSISSVAAASASEAPHEGQKRAPVGTSAPHVAQVGMCRG